MHAALDAQTVAARIQQVWIAVGIEAGIVTVVREEIAAEETRARCGLKVNTSDRLLLGAVVRNRQRITTAPIRVVRRVRNGKQLQQLECKRAEKRRIDLIIDERKPELLRRAAATRG